MDYKDREEFARTVDIAFAKANAINDLIRLFENSEATRDNMKKLLEAPETSYNL